MTPRRHSPGRPSTSTSRTEALARGFLGYDADYALSDSASLTFAAEAGYDTTEAVTLEARAGFSWTF